MYLRGGTEERRNSAADAKGCWSDTVFSGGKLVSSLTVMSESVLSLVQGIAAGFVTFHHAQHLHILREEAGRQQAVDAHLQTLLQREGHPLQGGGEPPLHTTRDRKIKGQRAPLAPARGQL